MDRHYLFIPHSPLQYEVYNYFAEALIKNTGIKPLGIDLGRGVAQLKPEVCHIEEWICLEELLQNEEATLTEAREKILADFEKEHAIVLAKDWYIDRAINEMEVSFEQARRLTTSYIPLIQKIFKDYNIMGVMSEKLFMPQRLTHYVAASYGVRHLNPIGDRFFNRFYFEDGIDGWHWKEAVKIYHSDDTKMEIPEEVEDVYKNVTDKAFKKIFTVHENKGKKNHQNPQMNPCEGMSLYCRFVLQQMKNNFVHRLRRRALKELDTLYKKRVFRDEIPDQPYVLFLYHMQPEYTVDGIATYYSNQSAVVEELAKRLPSNMPIVTKENPKNEVNILSSLGKYDVLKRLPNVFMVPKSTDSHTLIKGAEVIFTLTGTVGLEGLLFKKPVVCLGNIFYQNFKFCQKATSVAEAAIQIKNRFFANNEDIKATHEHPYQVLNAMYKGSYPGVMFNAFAPNVHRTEENIDALQQAFIEETAKILER
jgi:hypothetical protein